MVNIDNEQQLIEEIKRQMHRYNINQKELAKRTGLTESAISRWLNGNRRIRIDTAIMILNALYGHIALIFH